MRILDIFLHKMISYFFPATVSRSKEETGFREIPRSPACVETAGSFTSGTQNNGLGLIPQDYLVEKTDLTASR